MSVSMAGIADEIQRGLIWVSIVLFFILLIRSWKKVSALIKAIFFSHPIGAEIEQNWEINKVLVELRVLTDADRAYVLRFHNGTEFLPSHPVWKVTCTHEIVRPGVGYQAGKVQGVLVSWIPEIISSVITGAMSHRGITNKRCLDCDSKVQCRKDNKRIVLFQVADMEHNYSQEHFINNNTKTAILGGVTKNGSVYAMVGIDFTGERLSDDKIDEAVKKVCKSVNDVQYHFLTKREKSRSDKNLQKVPSLPFWKLFFK